MVEFQWFLMELSVLLGERIRILYQIASFITQTGCRDLQLMYEVILPSRKKLGDLCPAVAQTFVGFVDDSILFLSP